MTDRDPRPTYSPGNGYVTKRRVFTTLGILAAFLIGMGVNSGSENTQNWADAPASPSTTVTNRQLQELANPPGLATRDALPTSQIYFPPPAPTGPGRADRAVRRRRTACRAPSES